MADIVTMVLTRAGLKLYGKVQAGLTKLEIPRVVVGDGELDGADIYELVALKNKVDVETPIINYEQIGDGQLRLTFRITGTKDFYLREIGVMATDPDEGEILYCYCNYGEYAEYVMTYAGSIPVMQEADIYFAIGAAEELNVTINKDTSGVTHLEFEEHTQDRGNPHGVRAEQLFPDNSETLAEISAVVKSGYDAAAEVAHTHANGAALNEITQEKINAWDRAVVHMSRKDNPNNVTKEQVGLGNVTNESKATMFTDPVFTGVPKAPTAEAGTSTTQIATTEFVATMLKFAVLTSLTVDVDTEVSRESPGYFARITAVNAKTLIGTPNVTFAAGEVYASELEDLFVYCDIENDVLKARIVGAQAVPASAIAAQVVHGTVTLI